MHVRTVHAVRNVYKHVGRRRKLDDLPCCPGFHSFHTKPMAIQPKRPKSSVTVLSYLGVVRNRNASIEILGTTLPRLKSSKIYVDGVVYIASPVSCIYKVRWRLHRSLEGSR
jgi:hypothetical protein